MTENASCISVLMARQNILFLLSLTKFVESLELFHTSIVGFVKKRSLALHHTLTQRRYNMRHSFNISIMKIEHLVSILLYAENSSPEIITAELIQSQKQ